MSDILTKTGPNSEGEMLWQVHYKSSYYDKDSRFPGLTPVDERIYVLAKTYDEALKKASPLFADARKQRDEDSGEEIEVTIVTLESLIPARNSSNDGRLGWSSTVTLSPIKLSSPEDVSRYYLAVCLVPVS